MLQRLLCLIGLTVFAHAAFADARIEPVKAELVAEMQALVPGTAPNWLALKLTPEPGWHVYWRNWGDSGIATKLEWSLPTGVSAGDIVWPIPHTYRLGDLANYGYGSPTLHLVPITVAAGTRGPVTLAATAKWLVCKDVCIPGSAELRLTLPVAATATPDPAQRAAFAAARAALPQHVDWPAQFAVDADTVSIAVQDATLATADRISFYPYQPDLVNHAAPQRIAIDGAGLRLSQQRSTYFSQMPQHVAGVLVVEQGEHRQGYEIDAVAGAVASVAADEGLGDMVGPPPAAASTSASPASPRSLAAILGFALLGGLLLNLMPCVFPVLSLKALALARAGAGQQRTQALAYSAGVVLSCLGAAGLMLALRAAGTAVGWGFQLQSPVFVGALAYLLFALGLSLSGVAEFGGRLMNFGQKLTERGGLAGAFFTGVLAVIVASPCSAPLMGTALGYAMTQTAATALLIFAALGLGLALPFLVLALAPATAALLPKPGAWMLRFKQAMAFPLYLSVVWLMWVLARQLDATAAAQLAVGLVLVAFVLWLWSARGLLAALAKLAASAAAIALLLNLSTIATRSPQTEAWSAARVAELRAEGRTVFVDFTADWCLSCKVNERVALNTAAVQQAFREHEVTLLVADWTRADPAITAELERHGRSGVPLYLVYRKGGEPVILPQLLSPQLVIDAID